MSTTEPDPFDTPYVLPARPFDPRTAGRCEISEEGIERDQWGRPLILPPPGGWADPAPVKGQRVSGERP